jgi:hypothetical protein
MYINFGNILAFSNAYSVFVAVLTSTKPSLKTIQILTEAEIIRNVVIIIFFCNWKKSKWRQMAESK